MPKESDEFFATKMALLRLLMANVREEKGGVDRRGRDICAGLLDFVEADVRGAFPTIAAGGKVWTMICLCFTKIGQLTFPSDDEQMTMNLKPVLVAFFQGIVL